ncbi:MAG: hypothetical protein K2O84_06580 [Oscillospiraceae bacterium]|nr:hypothetical protein [Oscillospiraceae bacterium]
MLIIQAADSLNAVYDALPFQSGAVDAKFLRIYYARVKNHLVALGAGTIC